MYVCPNCHYENAPRKREGIQLNGENVYTPVKPPSKDGKGSPVQDSACRGGEPDTPQAMLRKRLQNTRTATK